jgi:hypothetical protein
MSMTIWINRGAAAACLLLSVLAILSGIAVIGDIAAVHAAERNTPAPAPATIAPPSQPLSSAGLKPLLRADASTPEVALGEFLNVRLAELGLLVNGVQAVSVRPLGGGLKLAEVRITGTAEAADVASVANWVAVNREAVRLKSLSVDPGVEGRGACTFVLLMVIA